MITEQVQNKKKIRTRTEEQHNRINNRIGTITEEEQGTLGT